jgi:virginiamycin B lyase
MKTFRVASILALAAAPLLAQDNPLEPKEHTVPWGANTRPRDPIMAKDGKVWFVGQTGNYVAWVDSKSGEFKQFKIDSGTNPHNINIDPNGGVWFTGNRNGKLYKINPADGKLTTIQLDPSVRDPHTMIWGKDGIAWFTAQNSQKVGRFDPKTGEVKLWTPEVTRSNPYGIVMDSKDRPWFDLFQTNRIGTIDPKTLELKEYILPAERARPRRIAVTSDDMVWYGDYVRGYLGRLDPKTGKVDEWIMPDGAGSLPYAMTVDDQDRLWLAAVGVQPNKLHAFDPKTQQWVASIPISSNGAATNTIRHMTFDKATRQIWFGTDAGTIGQMKVPTEIRKLVP